MRPTVHSIIALVALVSVAGSSHAAPPGKKTYHKAAAAVHSKLATSHQTKATTRLGKARFGPAAGASRKQVAKDTYKGTLHQISSDKHAGKAATHRAKANGH